MFHVLTTLTYSGPPDFPYGYLIRLSPTAPPAAQPKTVPYRVERSYGPAVRRRNSRGSISVSGYALFPLRQPAGRYGGERDRPAVAPPHTVARTRAETPDAHCAFGEAIARYRASNAANEQHHHGPDDHYKRSGASPGPKAGGPVFRVM